MVRRFLLPLLVLCAVGFGPLGCGSGGDDDSRGARRGAFVFAIPFVPTTTSEIVTLGFKNVTTIDATIHVTPYMPSGAMYAGGTTVLVVPGQGELRAGLAGLLGEAAAGGWVHVDTRDVTTMDAVTGEPVPVATSGFIFPYVERALQGGSAERDSLAGLAPRADEVRVCVSSATYAVQLVNHSIMEMAPASVPLPVTFDVDVVGSDGSTVSSSVVGPVPGNGTVALPFTPPFGTVGFVRVRPTTPAGAGEQYRFSVSSREATLQNHAEGRFAEPDDALFPTLVDVGFDVEFGTDPDGNVHDFGVFLCNGSGASQTVTLQAIYRLAGGQPMLTTPRLFVLRTGRSVFMGTTDTVSFGLEIGETSWFSDLFGDAFVAQDFEAVTLYIQAPGGVDVSARHFDPSSTAFYRILTEIPRTNRACFSNVPVATSTLSSTRTWISITNTTASQLTVPVRAFTPAMGTEYILPDLIVPPRSRLDWSPDGIQLREEPTATVGPFVNRLRLEFVPTVGALFSGRVESRDAGGQLLYIRPTIVRSN